MTTLSTRTYVKGLAKGKALFLQKGCGHSHEAPQGSPEEEMERLGKAFDRVRNDIGEAAAKAGESLREILSAHLEMLEDPMLHDGIQDKILSGGLSAPQAVKEACEELQAMFDAIDDEYLRARKDDVRDICGQLLSALTEKAGIGPSPIPQGSVLVAEEILPSDAGKVDFNRLGAIVTRLGSITSHAAIIARSYGIPVLMGIPVERINDGDLLLVNALDGTLTVNPDEKTEAEFDKLLAKEMAHGAEASTQAFKTAVTRDGKTIMVYANAGSIGDVRKAIEGGADGIGLFRSEFLFMQDESLPSEEKQYEAYRDAVLICNGKPLTIRTLDVGGDKALPCLGLPREENPFLGFRAIRISLARPEIFKPQVRAILRASAHGPVRILLPMIATLDEIRQARSIISQCMNELDRENIAYDKAIPVGIMVETPAAVLMADEFSKEADFFSLGTNDLTQYILAADRGNNAISELYDHMNPAVLRAVSITAKAARENGIPVCVCGEMAADEQAVKPLLESGVDSLSVPAPVIAKTKIIISE